MWTSEDDELWVVAPDGDGLLDRLLQDEELDDLVRWAELYFHPGAAPDTAHARRRRAERLSLWWLHGDRCQDLVSGKEVARPGLPPVSGEGYVQLGLLTRRRLELPLEEKLTRAQAEPLARILRVHQEQGPPQRFPVEVLLTWWDRHDLVLGPWQAWSCVWSAPAHRATPVLATLGLAFERSPDGRYRFELAWPETRENHPCRAALEALGELELVAPVAPPLPPGPWLTSEDVLELHTPRGRMSCPARFTFVQLARALELGEPPDRVEARLSLGRLVAEEQPFWGPLRHLLRAEDRMAAHLQPGEVFRCNDHQIEVRGCLPPATEAPRLLDEEASDRGNARLRRAFPDRKVRPQGALKNVRQALVWELLQEGGRATFEQAVDKLREGGWPMPHGVASLRKAWKRDDSVRETVSGELQLVPCAVLFDAELREALAGALAPDWQERVSSDPELIESTVRADPLPALLGALRVLEVEFSVANVQAHLSRLGCRTPLRALPGKFELQGERVVDVRTAAEQEAFAAALRERVARGAALEEGREQLESQLLACDTAWPGRPGRAVAGWFDGAWSYAVMDGLEPATVERLEPDDWLWSPSPPAHPRQVEWPDLSALEWPLASAGDLARLRRFGALHGCVPTRRGPVPVEWRMQGEDELWRVLWRARGGRLRLRTAGRGCFELLLRGVFRDTRRPGSFTLLQNSGPTLDLRVEEVLDAQAAE